VEIYLQYLEDSHLKPAIENKSVLYYKRYVDDLLIIFDETKTDADTISKIANKLDRNLTFKSEVEENDTMNYLDLSLNRTDNQINLNIYRKPTHIDITIPFTSNHTHLQKLAAFHYFIQRLNSLPITHKAKEQEWQQSLTTAHNNDFPEHIIQELKNKRYTNTNQPTHIAVTPSQPKTWFKFRFHSPAIYKVTNLFKNTNVKIAFTATNTIFHQLTQKQKKKQ
jgi:hypothetical protein